MHSLVGVRRRVSHTFRSGTGIGAPADAADHQPAEIGRGEQSMLRHELVDRGHAEELGNAVGWVADQLQRQAGIGTRA